MFNKIPKFFFIFFLAFTLLSPATYAAIEDRTDEDKVAGEILVMMQGTVRIIKRLYHTPADDDMPVL